MKFATLKNGSRDGALILVSRDLRQYQRVAAIAPTLQAALDNWDAVAPKLEQAYAALNGGQAPDAQPFDANLCHSPLPRAYQWADGSAYINHVELVRKARNAEVPASFYTDPLMYQGGSDSFIGPRDPIFALSEEWGIDLEAEVAVVTGDVAMGAGVDDAAQGDSPGDAGQRRLAAQPDSGRAGQGFRFLPVEGGQRVFARRRHAR